MVADRILGGVVIEEQSCTINLQLSEPETIEDAITHNMLVYLRLTYSIPSQAISARCQGNIDCGVSPVCLNNVDKPRRTNWSYKVTSGLPSESFVVPSSVLLCKGCVEERGEDTKAEGENAYIRGGTGEKTSREKEKRR